MKYIICVMYVFVQFSIYSQENRNDISKIETTDSLLIGKKIKRALRILDIDTNWTLIHEPPMIAQGISTNEINGYNVQLITKRIPMNKLRSKKSKKIDYSLLLRCRIIGISWKTEGKCKSIGDFLPQYAFDKYGPCEKK